MSDYTQIYIPYLSLILSVISIILYFYSIWHLPKKRAIDQYKIRIIREIYPALLSDLNESMEEWRNRKTKNIFSKLREIKKSGEIYFIKVNHNELYKNLMRIQDEILPSLEKVNKHRQASEHGKVQSKWRKILLDSSPKHDSDLILTVTHKVDNFLNLFFGHGHYFGHLVAEDITHYKEIIESQIQNNLRTLDNYELSPEIVEVLLDEASESRVEVNILISEIENQFKEIIEDGAIPFLHDKIGKPI